MSISDCTKQSREGSLKEQKSEEEKLAELEHQMLNNSVSTYRLKALVDLLETYHRDYIKCFQFGKRLKKQVIDDILSVYIPNIIRDFPSLVNKIHSLEDHVSFLEKELKEVTKQRNKAYTFCGWKQYQFFDSAEHIDPNDEYFKEMSEEIRKEENQQQNGKE